MANLTPKPDNEIERLKALKGHDSLDTGYNLSDIKELSNGDPVFVREMIKIFLTGTPEDLKKLKTAVQAGNVAESKRVAHKIKASYALFMIQPIAELCDKIEHGNDIKMIEEYSQIVIDSTNTILQSLAKELL